MSRMRVLVATVLSAAFLVALASTPSYAASVKASDMLGRVVVTTDGELLGRVEDFALDLGNGQGSNEISYVVVSIGSFLIDDNLVAVHPRALRDARNEEGGGEYLVLHSADLTSAKRFGDDRWPAVADVLPSDVDASSGEMIVDLDGDVSVNGVEADRVATITSGQRKATFKPGDRQGQIEKLENAARPASAKEAQIIERAVIQPKRFRATSATSTAVDTANHNVPGFAAMDIDADGYLSRREIAPHLSMSDNFGEFDLDANDGLDPFEFQVLQEHR